MAVCREVYVGEVKLMRYFNLQCSLKQVNDWLVDTL